MSNLSYIFQIYIGYGHLVDVLVLGKEDKKTSIDQPLDPAAFNDDVTTLTSIPPETFQIFHNLTTLNVSRQRIEELPGLEACKKLQVR